MVKVSIIVPIYNMEKLMRKCLDSILAQTFTEYECLLIDDGSTDGSPAICDEYAARDARFKAFHKPNGGLSDARNYGLAHAQGEYTIFFDPDDWVEEGCLKDMYAKAQKTDADMVICDYYNDDLYRSQYCKQVPNSLDYMDVLRDIITGYLYGYTWNKLLKRELYSRYHLLYPKGLYGCEDQYTMCALLKNDIKIAHLPKAYYHYMHYGNTTQSRRYDHYTYQQDIQIRDMFVELLTDTPYRELVYGHKTFSIFYRAFHFGNHFFSSNSFKQEFGGYLPVVKKHAHNNRLLYAMSIKGYYRLARSTFEIGYRAKQFYKKIVTSHLSNKLGG